MKFSKNSSAASVNGVAALAILRMLMKTLQKKKLLSDEEIDIILNCAEVEVDINNSTEVGGKVAEAKYLISNLLNDDDDDDDTTAGYKSRTGP